MRRRAGVLVKLGCDDVGNPQRSSEGKMGKSASSLAGFRIIYILSFPFFHLALSRPHSANLYE